MATTKTLHDRITEMQARIAQLENQKKQLIYKQKEAERKARTRRLIERGAILESLIDEADALTNEQVKTILAVALNTEAAMEAILAAQEKPSVPQPEHPPSAGPAGARESAQGAGA